jgi:hypothetical protein
VCGRAEVLVYVLDTTRSGFGFLSDSSGSVVEDPHTGPSSFSFLSGSHADTTEEDAVAPSSISSFSFLSSNDTEHNSSEAQAPSSSGFSFLGSNGLPSETGSTDERDFLGAVLAQSSEIKLAKVAQANKQVLRRLHLWRIRSLKISAGSKEEEGEPCRIWTR